MCADLDEQLHRWSIDTIDDNDGCIVCLQKLEQYAVGDDVAAIATYPLIIPDGHERGVMVTVGIDDGTRLETAEFMIDIYNDPSDRLLCVFVIECCYRTRTCISPPICLWAGALPLS